MCQAHVKLWYGYGMVWLGIAPTHQVSSTDTQGYFQVLQAFANRNGAHTILGHQPCGIKTFCISSLNIVSPALFLSDAELLGWFSCVRIRGTYLHNPFQQI